MFRHSWGCRTTTYELTQNWNQLESWAVEGDSPVRVQCQQVSGILSSAGHEKSCVNLPGPSGKDKYSLETDSEQVPWGKGEKNLEQRSEIDPEPIRLQAVGAFL